MNTPPHVLPQGWVVFTANSVQNSAPIMELETTTYCVMTMRHHIMFWVLLLHMFVAVQPDACLTLLPQQQLVFCFIKTTAWDLVWPQISLLFFYLLLCLWMEASFLLSITVLLYVGDGWSLSFQSVPNEILTAPAQLSPDQGHRSTEHSPPIISHHAPFYYILILFYLLCFKLLPFLLVDVVGW